MLLYSVPQAEILSFPEHPAEINMMSRDGARINYSFDVYINTSEVISAGAYTMIAQVLKNAPTPAFTVSQVASPALWNTRGKMPERAVISAAFAETNANLITQKNVDLTQFISNDLTNSSVRSPTVSLQPSLTRAQQNSISALSSVVTISTPFSRASSVSAPTTPGVVSSTTPRPRVPTAPVISSAMLSMKSDPATLTAQTFSSMASSSRSFAPLAASFVLSPPTIAQTMQSFRIVPTRQKITFSLSLKKSALSGVSSFCLNLELENSFGVKIDDIKIQVPHARIYNTFITPRRAPLLEAEYIKPGVVSVRVKPNAKERMAKSFRVFRRLTSPAEGGTDEGTPWVEVLRSDIGDMSEIAFRDEVATSRPIVYRAVSYGENFKPSESFSSTVVLPLKQFRVSQTGSLTAVSDLSFKGSNTFARIKVKDIPSDVVAVMVKRFNITNASDSERKASKGQGFVYVGRTPASQVKSVEGLGPNDTIQFADQGVKPGRKYNFVPVGVTKTGKQIVGSSSLLEVPLNAERQQVQMTVEGPRVINSSTAYQALSFELSAKFTDFGFSEIRRALSAGQQKSLFDQNLLEDRGRFEKLIGFLAERKNSRTGELESFGVIEVGEFRDDASTRRSMNVKPLEPGVEYTYKFTALINSPETLFPDLASSEVDSRTLIRYKRLTAKFQNPQALLAATLMSNQRQQDPSSASSLGPSDPLLAGRTNVEKSIEFRVPALKTAGKSLEVQKFKKFRRIVWTVSEASKVDHFKIYVSSGGGRVLIDTVHCDDASSEFYYRHYDSDYSTNYQYVVVPSSLSYEEMDVIKSSVISQTARRAIGLTTVDRMVVL